MKQANATHKKSGVQRLVCAFGHQYTGLSHGLRTDPAIRQVSGAVILLIPLSLLLPVGVMEHLALVLSTLLVLLLEFVNSAVEAAVDRISTEHHPLSGHAKDLASVAVAIAALMWAICWAVIAGPVVLGWLSK